jgi:ethanolamine utilization cobalamin adenosyltransferase
MRMRGMHKLILFRGSIDHYIAIMWEKIKLVEAPQHLKEDIANWVGEN